MSKLLPSAPVGVPADILRIVDTAIDVCNDRDRPAMAEDLAAVRLYVEQASAALAQQPAPPSAPVGVEWLADADIKWDMRHIEPHLKDADAAIPVLLQGVRRAIKRALAQQPKITLADIRQSAPYWKERASLLQERLDALEAQQPAACPATPMDLIAADPTVAYKRGWDDALAQQPTPPSAPVGVLAWLVMYGDRVTGWTDSASKDLVNLAEGERLVPVALTQQPASDGGFTAADMMVARQEGREEAQQPAAEAQAQGGGEWPTVDVAPEHSHIPCAKYPDLFEYHRAVSGEGEHAYTWSDKPHRLVYNLTCEVAHLRDRIAALSVQQPEPPSAPVGVEADAAGEDILTRALNSAYEHGARQAVFPLSDCAGQVREALTQQPAAEERGAYYVCPVCHGPGRVTRETHERYQQPAAVDGVLVRELRGHEAERLLRRYAAQHDKTSPRMAQMMELGARAVAALTAQHQEPTT